MAAGGSSRFVDAFVADIAGLAVLMVDDVAELEVATSTLAGAEDEKELEVWSGTGFVGLDGEVADVAGTWIGVLPAAQLSQIFCFCVL